MYKPKKSHLDIVKNRKNRKSKCARVGLFWPIHKGFFFRLKNIPKASGLGGRVKRFSQLVSVLSDQSLLLGIVCGLPPHPSLWLNE